MTNEEIKNKLQRGLALTVKESWELYKYIKTLEQQPRTNLAESSQDVLAKIRAEIENDWQLKKYPTSPFSCGLRRAIEIIDKCIEGSDSDDE